MEQGSSFQGDPLKILKSQAICSKRIKPDWEEALPTHSRSLKTKKMNLQITMQGNTELTRRDIPPI